MSTVKHQLTNNDFNHRVPGDVPKFTLDDIKKAIPAHCFERPIMKSMSYVLHDVVICAVVFLFSLFFQQIALKIAFWTSAMCGFSVEPLQPILETSFLKNVQDPASFVFAIPDSFTGLFGEAAKAFFAQSPIAALSSGSVFVYNTALTSLWLAHIIISGAVSTGLWVIGHECGHGGFSDSKAVSNAAGIIIHSLLLVPYYSWQISHRTHHSHTGDMELDEVHLPAHVNAVIPSAAHGFLHNDKWATEKDMKTKKHLESGFVAKATQALTEIHHMVSEVNFLHRLVSFLIMSLIGWILYLFINVSGRRYPKTSLPVNHFLPSSPVFKPNEAALVIASNAGLAAAVFLFYRIVDSFGWTFFFMNYVTVYFVTNYWLVTITYLQHTHPALPHFSTARWNYVQGAMATVDRNYGWFWNTTMHNIQDTHVAHHLFSYLPHYHAQEATEAIKKVIGPYYVKSEAESGWFGVTRELWASLKHLNFVAEDAHPALSVIESALDAETKGEDAVAAIAAVRDDALLKAPHVNGRDVSKEVFWFRSVNTKE